MKYNPRIIFLIVLAVTGHASFAQQAPFPAVKWLVGKWENQTQRGRMVEEWTKVNDSTLSGRSYMITATDSVILESILLKKEGTDVYYIPLVKGQNNEQPVKFKLTASSDKALVFENPAHDFPQKISYTLQEEKFLVAEISGIVNGQERARKFPMRKVN